MFKYTFNILGYAIIALLALILYLFYEALFEEKIQKLFDLISQNIDAFLIIVSKIM